MRFQRGFTRSPGTFVAAIALAAAFLPTPSRAAPGDLDPTFGTGGAAILAVGVHSFANALAVQSDGKILAATYIFDGSSGNMGVVRLDSTGALDATFGSGGVVSLPAGMQAIAQAIAIQPTDNKILVAGGVVSDPDLDYDFRIVRLLNDGLSDGQLDTTFGTGGVVVTPAAGTIGAMSVVVQPDGKILVGGDGKRHLLSRSKNRDFVVHRYLADGSPDTGFGEGGGAVISMGRRYDLVRSLLLQPAGAVLAAGYSFAGRSGRFALARLAADGTLDPTFGRNGRAEMRLVTRDDFAQDAALLPDGRILAGGGTVHLTPPVSSLSVTLAQFTSSGTLDPSFGTGGVSSVTPFTSSSNEVVRIALQTDGKIVGAGAISGLNDPPDVLLTRFLPDGSLDSSFGSGGVVRTLLTSQDQAFAVAIQPSDGGILVAGSSLVSGQSRMLVLRYLP
ncbi:MAG TPA: hypothetical protein VE911_04490 [Candidatus Nitrosopolaris sp.]|nr:hypothetical protein [Candidatus Nitrosopolaris sp.]